MDDFNNRINIQRHVLTKVNTKILINEELSGLSIKAIERWTINNNINKNSNLVSILNKISELIFFLASHSQDQISESYTVNIDKIAILTEELETELKRF